MSEKRFTYHAQKYLNRDEQFLKRLDSILEKQREKETEKRVLIKSELSQQVRQKREEKKKNKFAWIDSETHDSEAEVEIPT